MCPSRRLAGGSRGLTRFRVGLLLRFRRRIGRLFAKEQIMLRRRLLTLAGLAAPLRPTPGYNGPAS